MEARRHSGPQPGLLHRGHSRAFSINRVQRTLRAGASAALSRA
jgi:hypothetical protein